MLTVPFSELAGRSGGFGYDPPEQQVLKGDQHRLSRLT